MKVLLALLLALLSSALAGAAVLPLRIPLSAVELQAAAAVPGGLRFDEPVGAGPLRARVRGAVQQRGPVRAEARGGALYLTVPLHLAGELRPWGLRWLAREVSGTVLVSVAVQGEVRPDWSLGLRLSPTHRFAEPLRVRWLPGLHSDVSRAADPAVRAALASVTRRAERELGAALGLRSEAERLWRAAAEPLAVPLESGTLWVFLRPQALAVSPLTVQGDELRLNLGVALRPHSTLVHRSLGAALPPQEPARPLPPLQVRELKEGLRVGVPVLLPWAALEALAPSTVPLGGPLPLPELRIGALQLGAQGEELTARARLRLGDGPLALEAGADIGGRPVLRGGELTWEGARVRFARDSLSGLLLSLAEAPASAALAGLRFDTRPLLQEAGRALARELAEAGAAAGLNVSGGVGFAPRAVTVRPGGVVLELELRGELAATVR